MTTYADTVYSALLTAEQPLSSRALFDQHDTLETIERVNSTLSYLVKQGRAEVVGTEKPSNGKTIRLYRALTPDEQIERQPSAPADLDQQLAAAIRERDTELTEAVIEPLMGEWPDALEELPERPVFPRKWPTELQYDPDDVAFKRHKGLIDADPGNALRMIEPSDDPVIREIARYREPVIQDGHRLANHLMALASVIENRMPGAATSCREAANALQEFAA